MFRVKNLGKQYKDAWALKGVSFSLPQTGFIAIKGKSGSGKSTLLNILSSLEKPTEGEVYFEGNDITKFNDKKRSEFLSDTAAFVFQHFNLIEDLSPIENIEMPLLLKGEEKEQARFKSLALIKKYGLEEISNKKVSVLSGGEKQRVALCRALITSPKVLFADEPTGALDKENERKVLMTLKSLSKEILVIMVSHNEKLIEEFADNVIELSDGKLISRPLDIRHNTSRLETKKRKDHFGFLSFFLGHNYKHNLLKNALSIVSGVIGFTALLLSLGFYNGSTKTLGEEKTNSLLYTSATVTKKKTFEIEGSPLKLNQLTRPSLRELENAFQGIGARFAVDFSYFLPTFTAFNMNGFEEEPAEFHPIYDLSLRDRSKDFVVKGRAPSGNTFDYVLVNEEFERKYGDCLGKTLSVTNKAQVTEGDATDTLELKYSFRILGVVHEFSFLNSPKVYYSYPALEGVLDREYLPKISREKGYDLSIVDFLNLENVGSDYTGYSYLAFFGEEEVAKLETAGLEREGLTIVSDALTVASSFSSLTDAFITCLTPFLAIAIIGVAFILGSLSCSSFLERKKQAAILTCIGGTKEDLSFIYEGEGYINVLIASLISLIISFPAERLLSSFLKMKVGLDGLIRIPFASFMGIPFFPIVVLILFALIIALVGSSLPLSFVTKKPVVEELRDE